MLLRNVAKSFPPNRLRPCTRLFSADSTVAENVTAQQAKLAALEVDLKFTGQVMSSIVLGELKDDLRRKVWSTKYPNKSFDSTVYSKWIVSKADEEDKVVPFVNNLLPHDCEQRALLTWGTLRALSRPTWLASSIPAFEPSVGEIAYAVILTKIYDDHDLSFDVYEMVLMALGRTDVLKYMQREEMQKITAIGT